MGRGVEEDVDEMNNEGKDEEGNAEDAEGEVGCVPGDDDSGIMGGVEVGVCEPSACGKCFVGILERII